MKLPIPFNNPATYKGHSGVDYGQPLGTPFPASGLGTVTTLSRNAAGGFYIFVNYDDGPTVGYHHMDSHDGCPAVGARVVEGTRLGYVGNTGNSTGPHLHSEVAGHRTTAGYWRFFDRNRVVGARPAGGDITPITDQLEQEQNMELIRTVERYVVTPGKTGEYEATYGTRVKEYIVFTDTWYLDGLSQPVAKKWGQIIGMHSRLVGRSEAALLKNTIDSLPKATSMEAIDYDKLTAALKAAGQQAAGSYTITGTATPA